MYIGIVRNLSISREKLIWYRTPISYRIDFDSIIGNQLLYKILSIKRYFYWNILIEWYFYQNLSIDFDKNIEIYQSKQYFYQNRSLKSQNWSMYFNNCIKMYWIFYQNLYTINMNRTFYQNPVHDRYEYPIPKSIDIFW